MAPPPRRSRRPNGPRPAFGPGLVLRRSREGRSLAGEAAIMDFARRQGYPVPAVEEISDDGTELVLERIEGPSMVGAIERRPWNIRRYGAVLALLHRRLHAIPAPDFVPPAPVGHGDRLLHLDLHPLNVVMGPCGPVVIDWTNAARGDPAVDVGLAWLLLAAGEIPATGWKRRPVAYARSVLIGGFLARAEMPPVPALLAEIVEWKARDPHMSLAENDRMRRMVDARAVAPARRN